MKMTVGGYDVLRGYFGTLSQSFVSGLEALIAAFNADGKVTYAEAAYMLATAYHETAGTLQPVEEYGKGKGRKYGSKVDMDGKPYVGLDHIYYGRGFVQLTWLSNYVRAKRELGVDFVNQPELALNQTNAANIMILGMREGWFTGKRLTNYINKAGADFINARRIINGTDCADKIAKYAVKFKEALSKP